MNKSKTTPNTKNSRKTVSKQEKVIALLRRVKGASLAEIGRATDWQEHSIRGFLSGTLKKRLKLNVMSEKDTKGIRRYRIAEVISSAEGAA